VCLILDAVLVVCICVLQRKESARLIREARDEERGRSSTSATAVGVDEPVATPKYQDSRPPTPMPGTGVFGAGRPVWDSARPGTPPPPHDYVPDDDFFHDHQRSFTASGSYGNNRMFLPGNAPRTLIRQTSSTVPLVQVQQPSSPEHRSGRLAHRDPSITTILCDAIVAPELTLDDQQDFVSRAHAAGLQAPPRKNKHMTCNSMDIALGRIPM